MAVVGGLRTRFVRDSVRKLIYDSLNELGWFDSGRNHKSVSVLTKPIDEDQEIEPNIVTVTIEDSAAFPAELGNSVLTEDQYDFAIDIYGESDALAEHLKGDIEAIIWGRFSAFRSGPTVSIYDFGQATPSVISTGDIENINTGKNRVYTKPFQRHWWTVFFSVIDEHSTDA